MKFVNGAILFVFPGLLMMNAAGCQSTNAGSEPILRFGVAADIQYAEKPSAGGRYYADSLAALQRCVADFATRDMAFAIQLGDIIDGGPNARQELETIAEVYRQLPIPGYHTLGNHDFVGIDRASVLAILGMDKSYYSFDAGGWRFVVLDTQDLAIQGGWGENSERYRQSVAMLEALRATGSENAADYNGGIGPKQKQWLSTVLQQADTAGQKVLVFGHLPLMPAGEKHTLWNAGEIAALFEGHDCVKAYFCGHRHGGGYTAANGIHYVTFEAMVDAAGKDGAWAVVTLSGDSIHIDGAGAVTSRHLSLSKSR